MEFSITPSVSPQQVTLLRIWTLYATKPSASALLACHVGKPTHRAGVSAGAASCTGLRWAAIPAFAVELASFCCAFILRGHIVKAVRQSMPSSGEGPTPLAQAHDSTYHSGVYEPLCWFVMVGNVMVAIGVVLAAVCFPYVWSVVPPAWLVELLSFYCAFIMRRDRIFAGTP